MSTTAKPGAPPRRRRSCVTAARPPADAPTATIGNDEPNASLAASVASDGDSARCASPSRPGVLGEAITSGKRTPYRGGVPAGHSFRANRESDEDDLAPQILAASFIGSGDFWRRVLERSFP
jgi:hypothetical protein